MAAREWVTKRETMMKAATDDVVAIYAKMAADAAATQLAAMDETVAAAVLAKLKPQVAERHSRRDAGGQGGQALDADRRARPGADKS